ncbi:unnamed protein product [Rotaria socialis]|uniref:Uncharacterized protein n=1 Tax=Rotaria socialis TaxID=392032 RepID=A0A820SMI1_9BILA|nr:unnamed protein product [Rotaria socialis]CAF3377694.1 unnamed protein product [Rotaria socialis]CAF4380166.1 unnamed protein product [Rotaria socialis]CAF4452774.1 unnamed protein product [Rotaria socialis]
MDQLIFIVLSVAIIQLSCACYITNCPIGGKRSLLLGNNLISHQCPRCGLNGQCFGSSICCTGLACRIGHPFDVRQCSLENRSVTPCDVNTSICSAVSNGRCAANGVCCSADSCQMDKSCLVSNQERDDSSREDYLAQAEIMLFE